ncbi:hypothetical protein [Planococcus sp. ISL-109]|uniref:hypothetical protein n=1 Tax=Planococcus sp. ISL-109 TaxID=2819166 RepID=UPI001BE70916|nr:hypothetical protein [Planococcus sp. ISL-109]MBT2582607.1 hypothetical protein [Planococcus sp. ISL-109]
MTDEWMVEEVSTHLYGYLKEGTVHVDSVFHKASPSIDRLEDLLKLRFIKSRRTIAFMKALEHELSSIKSSTDSRTSENYFEVRGEVMWQETIQRRLETNPKDTFRFVTRETERTFQTDENLVLKELLIKLHHYCFEDPFLAIFRVRPWYEEVMESRGFVEQGLFHNVYVSRVEWRNVSNRTIEKTKSHRKRIYREAAHLLSNIRKTERGEFSPEELHEVLHEFFIVPSNKDVLFELYWIVQLIKQQQHVTYHLMDRTRSKVASWTDGGYDFHLYHDSTGSNRVKFHIHSDELKESTNPYLIQETKSFQQYNDLAKTFFNQDKSLSYWRGRPDILVEKVESGANRLVEVTIGEIKNTQSIQYASKGLSELLTYIHLIKEENGRYLMGKEIQVKGLLCIGAIELHQVEKDNIKVVSLLQNQLV